MVRRSLIGAVSTVTLAAAISACGGSGTKAAAGNGLAAKPASAIIGAASAAIKGLKSVHVSGSVVSGGTPITLDLDLVTGEGGRGSMSTGGLSFQIVVIGKTLYIDGSQGFWRHFGGAAAAQLFKGKWLKTAASESDVASLSSLTNLKTLFDTLFASHGKLVTGKTTSVDGQKVVAVNDTTKGGTLYVATTGPAYPIEFTKTGSQGGRIVFDHFDAKLSVKAPAHSIDVSSLK